MIAMFPNNFKITFAFNIRKDLFKNKMVRKALTYAFDFEWTNKNLFYGAYKRTNSFFENSELASSGIPQEKEFKLLKNYLKSAIILKSFVLCFPTNTTSIKPRNN